MHNKQISQYFYNAYKIDYSSIIIIIIIYQTYAASFSYINRLLKRIVAVPKLQ